MGERCNAPGVEPTREELDAMAAQVREGVAAGALGFSTSRTLLHKDKHGVHMPGNVRR
jgi:N-acyl-D-aspartate/D-glutamate deacylase